MALGAAAYGRRSQMRGTDVLDMTVTAWLIGCRYIGMVSADLVTAEAGRVRNMASHSDYRKPACAREQWLVACIASLCEDGMRRRKGTGRKSNGTP